LMESSCKPLPHPGLRVARTIDADSERYFCDLHISCLDVDLDLMASAADQASPDITDIYKPTIPALNNLLLGPNPPPVHGIRRSTPTVWYSHLSLVPYPSGACGTSLRGDNEVAARPHRPGLATLRSSLLFRADVACCTSGPVSRTGTTLTRTRCCLSLVVQIRVVFCVYTLGVNAFAHVRTVRRSAVLPIYLNFGGNAFPL
jgi:hypothetical protein